jgi:integrase
VLKGGNGTPGARHLEERDLRAFVRALLALDSTAAEAVIAALWLGGQRALQLARVRLADLDGDELRLLDPKGKRERAGALASARGPGRGDRKQTRGGFARAGSEYLLLRSIQKWRQSLPRVARHDERRREGSPGCGERCWP